MNQLTPMLKQYMEIKDQYPDAILFFRMGDFYEMFFDDAETASRILGITLTARGQYMGESVPMCGVPHHASNSYIARLVESGCKVAICEQTEDPKSSKGLVNRDVVRLVTPGSMVDEGGVDSKRNLYMAAVSCGDGRFGLAYTDLSTGEFRVTEFRSLENLTDELGRVEPAEVLVLDKDGLYGHQALSRYRIESISGESFDPGRSEALVKQQLGVRSLAGFGCQDMPEGVVSAGILVYYLKKTQKGNPDHIQNLLTYRMGDYMFLDESTCSHLELLRTMRRQSIKGSLAEVLDRTVTPMGSRLLKKWIVYPLVNLERIRKRLGAVACLKEDPINRQELRTLLKAIYDLERLNGSISLGRANARDLVALKQSVYQLPHIKQQLTGSPSTRLTELVSELDTLQDVAEVVEKSIHDDPPVSTKEGGIIKEGFDEELDRLISMSRNGKSWITEFAAREREKTGIGNLKVGFNKVYGYYIEVSKANLPLVPQGYIRKQTLVNGERYITESLKEMEEQVLSAEERRVELEFQIFDRIRRRIAEENQRIKRTAEIVAVIDVLQGLGEVAELNNYTRPHVTDGTEISIVEGRHPVVEQRVKEEEFVPNDIHMDSSNQTLLIITGPNMAGKSTILRQTALTVLMAQSGSFVPASEATIGIVDRIFTRVGASDDLSRGQSTFMVEMNETANILRHASSRSLVVLDEIGRGTSTYDGLSIAWAVAETLHDRDGKGVRTLFATHYHELTELVSAKERVKNFNVAVREWKDRIIFLRKMVPGGTSRSYGVEVARIAGLPSDVLRRAKEILEKLEGREMREIARERLGSTDAKEQEGHAERQMDLFKIRDRELRGRIQALDISSMTPLEALVELNRLKEYVESAG